MGYFRNSGRLLRELRGQVEEIQQVLPDPEAEPKLVIPVKTADPESPVVGEMWIIDTEQVV